MRIKVYQHIKQEIFTARELETPCCTSMAERGFAPTSWNYCAFCGEHIEYVNGEDVIETVSISS